MSQQRTNTATVTSPATTVVGSATVHPASVKLVPSLTAQALIAHIEAGRTDIESVDEFLCATAYPVTEIAKLAGILGDRLGKVLAAQQGMAVVHEAREPKSRKAGCSVTRAEFRTHAKPVDVTVGDVPLTAVVKEFSTGSLGWNLTGKTTMRIGDKTVTVQIGLNMTVIGSKELA